MRGQAVWLLAPLLAAGSLATARG